MKKLLSLSILSLSMLVGVTVAEAKTTTAAESVSSSNAAVANLAVQPRRTRIVTRTRIVRRGGVTYRETWRTTRFANGRVVTKLISRVRVR